MIILCITNFEMLMSKSLKNKSSFCFYCVFRKLSAVLHQYSSSQRKWWTKTLTLQCENSMKTNTSNRWLPFRGQHPFKIHMQLLKHPCRNIHTHTHTQVHFPPIHTSSLCHCAHMHLSHTLPVCEPQCVKRVWEVFEHSRELQPDTSGWFHLFSLHCSFVPRMWVCLLNRDVCVEWMAVALSWIHIVLDLSDSLGTYRRDGCRTVNLR